MSLPAHRWLMTAPGAPLVRAEFDATPGPGEVAVEVAGCGVCHTDLGYYYDGVRTNAPLPLALGHEVSGRVVAAGAGAEAWIGRAVIVPAVLPCGECDLCRRGLAPICRSQKMPGNDIQGGFASHIVVPARGLCPVDEQRLAQAGLTLAQVSIVADALTTPYQAVRRAVRGGIARQFATKARRDPAVLACAENAQLVLALDSGAISAAWWIARRVPAPPVVSGLAAAERELRAIRRPERQSLAH